MSNGIPCPKCGSQERRVIESRRRVGDVYRRCVCGGCGSRYTTRERVECADTSEPNTLLLAKLRDRVASLESNATSLRLIIEDQLPL